MKFKLLASILFLILSCIKGEAQDKVNVKFGKVSPEDFVNIYGIDSNANAIVVADVGSSQIIGNTKSSFSLEFKRYCRDEMLREFFNMIVKKQSEQIVLKKKK